MTRNELKDKRQREGLNKWASNNFIGTLQYCTGVGKTRCGVLGADYFAKKYGYDFTILIVTPTETIRDTVWESEFKKWGASLTFKKCVKTVCIQTAYKWVGQVFDLVILDEVHNYLPSFEDYLNKNYEYFKFFENNKCLRVLGLSASIDASRLFALNKIAKIVDTITTQQARTLGLVSNFEIFNLGIELTEEERKEYDIVNRDFDKYFSLFIDGSGFKNLSLMYKCLQSTAVFKQFLQQQNLLYHQYAHYPSSCNRLMARRKEILYNAANKISMSAEVVKKFSDRLAIIFSLTTPTADAIAKEIGQTCVPYHSKISKKKRQEYFSKLNDGRTKINAISAVKAINEGVNIPKCSLIVITSGTSKQKDFIQTVGRGIRFEEGKITIIVRLYIKNSQEERWVKSSQNNYFINEINSIDGISI